MEDHGGLTDGRSGEDGDDKDGVGGGFWPQCVLIRKKNYLWRADICFEDIV